MNKKTNLSNLNKKPTTAKSTTDKPTIPLSSKDRIAAMRGKYSRSSVTEARTARVTPQKKK